jgi:two-component system, NarL family, response regulator DegU
VIIGMAVNGLDLLYQLENLVPDINLLDIGMPDMDGPEALQIIKMRYPAIKVIIHAMHNESSVIALMMSFGANAYLTKEA